MLHTGMGVAELLVDPDRYRAQREIQWDVLFCRISNKINNLL